MKFGNLLSLISFLVVLSQHSCEKLSRKSDATLNLKDNLLEVKANGHFCEFIFKKTFNDENAFQFSLVPINKEKVTF